MADRLTKMGGWWRLWLVTSVIWTAIIIATLSPSFPADRWAEAEIGDGFPVQMSDVPMMITDSELTSKLERKRTDERAYAGLVRAMVAGHLTSNEFARRTKALGFRPEKDWTTSDVPPLGAITIKSTPRKRLLTWASTTVLLSASFPLALLISGLSFRWVRDGFKRNKPTAG